MKFNLIFGAVYLLSIPASFAGFLSTDPAVNAVYELNKIVDDVKDTELRRLAKGCVQEVRNLVNDPSELAKTNNYEFKNLLSVEIKNRSLASINEYSLGSLADVLAHAICLAPINDRNDLLNISYPMSDFVTIYIREPNEITSQIKKISEGFESTMPRQHKIDGYLYTKRLRRISLWSSAIEKRYTVIPFMDRP